MSFILQGAAGTNVQVFSTSGTWSKPSGVQNVLIECWGAGGGGGSGCRGAAGTLRTGGSGGGGGGYRSLQIVASDLPSTVSVTVGLGGAGGAAVTVDSTNGNDGVNGGDTLFGVYLTAYGGGNGYQGSIGGGYSGGIGGGLSARAVSSGYAMPRGGSGSTVMTTGYGGFAAGGNVTGDVNVHYMQNSENGGGTGGWSWPLSSPNSSLAGGRSFNGGAGGGSGAMIDATNTIIAASVGGTISNDLSTPGGGPAGIGIAVAGRIPFTGGGGGASGVIGFAGGRCSGGGGGGSTLNGTNSGAGGAGGNGYCRVTSW